MELRKALLAGISATALIVAASAGAWADDAVDDVRSNSDNNDQDIDIGEDNDGNGFNDSNAVAVAALQQSSVQVVASENQDAIDDNYDADMDFGDNTFSDQILNNNNFNTGVNAVQGNALAVAGSSSQSIGNGGSVTPPPVTTQ